MLWRTQTVTVVSRGGLVGAPVAPTGAPAPVEAASVVVVAPMQVQWQPWAPAGPLPVSTAGAAVPDLVDSGPWRSTPVVALPLDGAMHTLVFPLVDLDAQVPFVQVRRMRVVLHGPAGGVDIGGSASTGSQVFVWDLEAVVA